MQHKILVVEDDLELSATIKEFLELSGYAVFCAYDTKRAEEILFEKGIDLILLDVKLPFESGFSFLERVRQSNNTPTIFITSLNSIDDVERGFLAGGDDYIKKPFELKELILRIQAALKKSYKSSNTLIALDAHTTFDIQNLHLQKDGKTIALKTKELKLLKFFLQHPNELLTYEAIFQALWKWDEEPSIGSLRTYVKTLRSILPKNSIETIKNVGYRFVKQ